MTALLTHDEAHTTTTQPATPAGRGLIRAACHRIYLTVAEMNDASRRLVELQAPWSVDKQWYRR